MTGPMRTPLAAVLLVFLVTLPASAGEFHRAIAGGDSEAVARMLKSDPTFAGAPDEEDQYASMPIHIAAFSGNVEIARMLLDAGADLETGDSDESTPLHVAALNRRPEMVAFLIERGADVNRRDRNQAYALSFAASGGDTAVVRMILGAGADLNFTNDQGVTLLHFAASRRLDDLFRRLVDRGDAPNAATVRGSTVLHWASDPAMIETLLDLGVEPSPVDSSGDTPLMNAIFRGNADAARVLIDHGADVNMANRRGCSPLQAAAMRDNPELTRLLIGRNSNVNCRTDDGKHVLVEAAMRGNAEIVRLLLDAGSETEVGEPAEGLTALHASSILGYGDVVEELLGGGAKIDAKDKMGRTPIELAARFGNMNVVRLLKSRGAGQKRIEVTRDVLARHPVSGAGEAAIWYLGHSGWAIKTKNNLMIFDYFEQGRNPDEPALCNGRIDPAEFADEKVTVFVSHEHGDHFDPMIFDWREKAKDITYVLGCRADSAPPYEFTGPRESRTINGIEVTTIESNDTGVGFLLEVDGLVIYHAGDHANRQRDFSGTYKAEIDWLAARGVRPDIAFMPISGCGFGDQEAVKMGVHYALDTLLPALFLPMHAGRSLTRYREFVTDCGDRFPETRMEAVHHRGEEVRYKKEKTS